MVHPAHNRGVDHRQAAFGHHPYKVTIAQFEAQIPPYAQNNDVPIEVTTLEQFIQTQKPRRPDAFSPPKTAKMGGPDNLNQSQAVLPTTGNPKLNLATSAQEICLKRLAEIQKVQSPIIIATEKTTLDNHDYDRPNTMEINRPQQRLLAIIHVVFTEI